jgi:hypothetical protein
MIDVRETKRGAAGFELEVTVREGRGETRHRVTMSRTTYERLAGASEAGAEAVLRAAFAFLLDREPKESILARFDLDVIARYFPEFEDTIGTYLEASRRP